MELTSSMKAGADICVVGTRIARVERVSSEAMPRPIRMRGRQQRRRRRRRRRRWRRRCRRSSAPAVCKLRARARQFASRALCEGCFCCSSPAFYPSITDPLTSLMSFVFHSSFAIFTSRRPPSAPRAATCADGSLASSAACCCSGRAPPWPVAASAEARRVRPRRRAAAASTCSAARSPPGRRAARCSRRWRRCRRHRRREHRQDRRRGGRRLGDGVARPQVAKYFDVEALKKWKHAAMDALLEGAWGSTRFDRVRPHWAGFSGHWSYDRCPI